MQAAAAVADALARALPRRLERDGQRLDRVRQALVRVGPRLTVPHQLRLERDFERAHGAGRGVLEGAERRVSLAAARLDDLSPVAILGRGYSVCYQPTGRIVRSSDEVARGDRVEVRLARGRLGCLVERTESESED
jgi:exodeoxyribonuclease VII large subunit